MYRKWFNRLDIVINTKGSHFGDCLYKELKIKDYGRLQRKAHHRAKGTKGEAD